MRRWFPKSRLHTATVSLLAALVVAVAGCASGPKVPREAKLIWFGSSSVNINADDLPPGTFYLVENSGGRTISAVYNSGKQPMNWNGLKSGKKYRLYFLEGPVFSSTQPVG
jgi:hypothetical protein